MVERILSLIKQMGISVSAVEKQLGFGNGAIKRFSTSSPSVDKIITLSNFLNTSVEYILFGNENILEQPEDIKNLIAIYKSLSDKDKGIILGKAETLAELAAERAAQESKKVAKEDKNAVEIVELADDPQGSAKYSIMYFNYPASAGTGLFLDETMAEEISVRATPQSYNADFAIPISGDSMEPEFSSGDIVLVESCPNVAQGKVGIFVLDGDVYIKEYGGDRLISYNEAYSPILLKEFETAVCLGRVLGKAEIIK